MAKMRRVSAERVSEYAEIPVGELAQAFHEAYERLAPTFRRGHLIPRHRRLRACLVGVRRLMVAVAAEVLAGHATPSEPEGGRQAGQPDGSSAAPLYPDSSSGSLGAAEAGKAEALVATNDAVATARQWCASLSDPLWPGLTESDWASLMEQVLAALAAERARAATLERALADNERDARWIVGQWQRLRDEPLNEVAKAIVTRARDAQEHQT